MKNSMKKLFEKIIPNGDLRSRKEDVCMTKHLMRYSYKMYGFTLKEISNIEGKATGKAPHHSTVIHSIEYIDNMIAQDIIKFVPLTSINRSHVKNGFN